MNALPQQSRLRWRVLELAFPWLQRLHLQAVHMHAEDSPPPADRAVLIGNHCSWWDGFLHWRLARHIGLERPHYTVMLEEQIRRSPALRGLGAIGLEPGSVTGVRAAVKRLQGLARSGSRFSVSLFPQGAIWPTGRRPLGFMPGAAALLRPLMPCTVLPIAVHMEPGNRSRPSAFVLAGPALGVDDTAALRTTWEGAVTDTLDKLLNFLHTHGEAAAAEWPPR